jgi:hypothetical protein
VRVLCVAVATLAVAGACRGKSKKAPPRDAAPVASAADAGAAPTPLAAMPKARPRWTVTLDAAPVPAVDVHGPILVGDAALVAGSAIGIAGIDIKTGAILTERPAAGSVGIAALDDERALAVGDCTDAIRPPKGDALIGCYVVMDAHHEAVYGAGSIVAPQKDAAQLGGGATTLFISEKPPRLAFVGRDDPDAPWLRFVLADPPRGEVLAEAIETREVPIGARAASVSVPAGQFWVVDDVLEVRHHDPQSLSNRSSVMNIAAAPGALHALDDDRVRAFRLVPGERALQPIIIDPATLRLDDLGTAVPGIDLLAAAHGTKGYAIAVRLDTSLANDYVAAFTTDGTLSYAYALPPPPNGGRALPVGIAMTDDAVIVFHDGNTISALPPP